MMQHKQLKESCSTTCLKSVWTHGMARGNNETEFPAQHTDFNTILVNTLESLSLIIKMKAA